MKARSTAVAHPNIALVKYWGKRDPSLILPHQSSLSLTLSPLSVTTSVEWDAGEDSVEINAKLAQGSERERVVQILDLVRNEVGPSLGSARVVSKGDFPAAAGLASSAAGFAALALAARNAAGLPRDVRAESILARRGSGSACRSIQGGACVWQRGERGDGSDSFARQAFSETHWPQLRLLVAMLSKEEKETKSRDGMALTVESSPYYAAWAKDAEAEIPRALSAMERRDFQSLGELCERNAWRMHATAFAANPPLCYFLPKTLALILALKAARKEGLSAYFTLDAGPNPLVVTLEDDVQKVERLALACGAEEVVRCQVGGDARIVEDG